MYQWMAYHEATPDNILAITYINDSGVEQLAFENLERFIGCHFPENPLFQVYVRPKIIASMHHKFRALDTKNHIVIYRDPMGKVGVYWPPSTRRVPLPGWDGGWEAIDPQLRRQYELVIEGHRPPQEGPQPLQIPAAQASLGARDPVPARERPAGTASGSWASTLSPSYTSYGSDTMSSSGATSVSGSTNFSGSTDFPGSTSSYGSAFSYGPSFSRDGPAVGYAHDGTPQGWHQAPPGQGDVEMTDPPPLSELEQAGAAHDHRQHPAHPVWHAPPHPFGHAHGSAAPFGPGRPNGAQNPPLAAGAASAGLHGPALSKSARRRRRMKKREIRDRELIRAILEGSAGASGEGRPPHFPRQ